MDESLIISFGTKFQALMTLIGYININACWYLNKFIWITVSSSGARDNEMLGQRNIQEVIFYFVQKDKLVL